MGIKSFFFGSKRKEDDIHRERIAVLNEELANTYHVLKKEQDEFEVKNNAYTITQESIRSKRVEIDNRLGYLQGIMDRIGEKIKEPFRDIKEFKELCQSYVSTHNDIEVAQTELHETELHLEDYFKSWEIETLEHNCKVDDTRMKIEEILSTISQLNKKDT
jgi:uncharacterized coiled-coil DUF342 family protein